jgi:hypothetical protein
MSSPYGPEVAGAYADTVTDPSQLDLSSPALPRSGEAQIEDPRGRGGVTVQYGKRGGAAEARLAARIASGVHAGIEAAPVHGCGCHGGIGIADAERAMAEPFEAVGYLQRAVDFTCESKCLAAVCPKPGQGRTCRDRGSPVTLGPKSQCGACAHFRAPRSPSGLTKRGRAGQEHRPEQSARPAQQLPVRQQRPMRGEAPGPGLARSYNSKRPPTPCVGVALSEDYFRLSTPSGSCTAFWISDHSAGVQSRS